MAHIYLGPFTPILQALLCIICTHILFHMICINFMLHPTLLQEDHSVSFATFSFAYLKKTSQNLEQNILNSLLFQKAKLVQFLHLIL